MAKAQKQAEQFTKKDVDAYFCKGCRDGAELLSGIHVYHGIDLKLRCKAKQVYSDDEISKAREATMSRGSAHAAQTMQH